MLINDVALPDIPQQYLRDLYSYWDSKKHGRTMPSRSDIRPEQIQGLLSYIVLIDVERNPLRFKARLVGTRTVNALGQDFTGMYFNDFPDIDNLVHRLENLLGSKNPYFVSDNLQWLEKEFLDYYALVLPLSENDKDVNKIMLGIYYPALEKETLRFYG